MRNHTMKCILFTAVAAFSLAGAPAFAGEGNYDPFPLGGDPLVGSVPTRVTEQAGKTPQNTKNPPNATPGGMKNAPWRGVWPFRDVPVTTGAVLPSNSSNGVVQTANSLPRGWAEGTPAYEYARSVSRHFAAQARLARQQATSVTSSVTVR